MAFRTIQLVLILALLAALTSCASGDAQPGARTLASLTPTEAVAVLQVRAASCDSTASAGTMTLTSAAGERVTLDFAARTRGDDFRLRAWRFGEAVLDVTVNRQGAWLYTPQAEDVDDAGHRDGSWGDVPDLPTPDDLARAWTLISGRLLENATVVEAAADTLTLASEIGGRAVQVEVDRARLRPVKYRLPNSPGTSVDLDPADWIDAAAPSDPHGSAWPRRVTLISPRGRVEVAFSRAEVNVEHPAGVFEPPGRAKRIERNGEGQ